jgi:hypothetical protein
MISMWIEAGSIEKEYVAVLKFYSMIFATFFAGTWPEP